MLILALSLAGFAVWWRFGVKFTAFGVFRGLILGF
jgi:hypothetical protein